MADKADKTDTRATGSTGRADSAKSLMILLKRPLTEELLPAFSLLLCIESTFVEIVERASFTFDMCIASCLKASTSSSG